MRIFGFNPFGARGAMADWGARKAKRTGKAERRSVPRAARSLLALALLAVAGCVPTTPAVPASVGADADYLLRLGLMRGHLLVGHALFVLGERHAARTHAKHPGDELYAGLEREFAARGVAGFAAELAAHAGAVESNDEIAITQAYAALKDAIARSERAVALSPGLAARVIVLLLEEAATEYAVGIVDGQLENAHEYQDAYGFTQVALELARAQHAALDAGDSDRQVFARVIRRVAMLSRLWPALVPPSRVDRQSVSIAAAARDIADMALRLRAPRRLRQ